MEQRSLEWFQARLGKVTASRINDVMATIKSGEAADRKNYRMQLVVERLTGAPVETYTNGAMQWGIDNEAAARAAYEFVSGNTVEEIGFIDHPEIDMAGASPDGFIGEEGLLEIKCPNTATHIEWMLSGGVPAKHLKQIQFQLDCTGRKWCDFVSYDPRMPMELQLFTVRVARMEPEIEAIRAAVKQLLSEIEETIGRLKAA